MFIISGAPLAASAAIFCLTYMILKLVHRRRFYRDLPKPPHSFLWGHLKLMGEISRLFPDYTHPQYFYTEIAKRYSMPDIWYMDLWPLGPAQMVVTGADAAAAVIATRGSFPIHNVVGNFLAMLFGPNVIAGTNGPLWKALHHITGPSFASPAIKSSLGQIGRHTMVYREHLKEWSLGTEPVSMADGTAKLVFDVISDFVLGLASNTQESESPLLMHLETLIDYGWMKIRSWNPITQFKAKLGMRYNRIQMDKIIEAELKRRFKVFVSEKQRPLPIRAQSVLDRLLLHHIETMDKRDQDMELEADFLQLALANLKGFLVGGYSSTTDTLCYIFMLLGLHPHVMQRLREEHEHVFGPNAGSVIDILDQQPSKSNELHYTTAVIKETLRLFPIGFGVRAAPEGVTTLEYKGEEYPITNQMILSCTQATHYDPKHFFDPSRFFPDRFLDTYEPKAHRFAWRPFERGPRTCMGQEMAIENMKIVLLLTARWFDFELLIEDKGGNSDVQFTELNNLLGDQAFGRVKMSAGPRRGAPMRVKRTDRPWV